VSGVHQLHKPVILVISENIKALQVIPNASHVIQVNSVLEMVHQKIAQQVIGAQEQQ